MRPLDHLDHLADFPVEIAALDRKIGQIHHCLGSTGLVQSRSDVSHNLLEAAIVQIALPAAADQQHSLAQCLGHVEQQQRLAQLAFQVATAQQVAEIAAAGGIELLGRNGQSPRFVNAQHQAGGALFFWIAALDRKFHRRISSEFE